MEIEINQLQLRYEKLRRRSALRERRLVASLVEKGQQFPVVVIDAGDTPRTYVLIDGYKRTRALKKLRHDTVQATVWDLCELDAVLLERLMRTTESDGALEQGWLLEELNERFALSHEELARRFDKSQSWVSRRLALVRAVPREVQEEVRRGTLPAHAVMKYLVPMARAKRSDCVRLVGALRTLRPSTRDVEAIYAAWVAGDAQTRELVVTQPSLVLRAREQTRSDDASAKTPGHQLIKDFGTLIGVSRRARAKLVQGILGHLLPAEVQHAKHVARQARWECEALFRCAAPLLDEPAPAKASGAPAPSSDVDVPHPTKQESTHAR